MLTALLQILLIGDSLFTSTATHAELERAGVEVVVDAKVGRRATEAHLRFCPDTAFVQLGSNDAVHGQSAEGLAALRELYRKLRVCNSKLLVMLPPGSSPKIRAFAQKLFDHAQPSGGPNTSCTVLLSQALPGGTPDGVHPTVRGYRELGRRIAQELK